MLQPRETTQHFMIGCPAYTHERWKLKPKKGRSELKYAEVVRKEKGAIALAHYITDTRRFMQEAQDQQCEKPMLT
jgi:hypothetical protein